MKNIKDITYYDLKYMNNVLKEKQNKSEKIKLYYMEDYDLKYLDKKLKNRNIFNNK